MCYNKQIDCYNLKVKGYGEAVSIDTTNTEAGLAKNRRVVINMNILPVMKSLTMSSREIAELTGKQHKHVLRDIREMVAAIHELKDGPNLDHVNIPGVFINKDDRGYISIISLDRDYTFTLLTGYDAKARFKVIQRWRELEEQAAAQANKVAAATTWEQQRQAGKEVRANFTSTLKNHGVSGFGFAQCTDGIYRPLFGSTAAKIKRQRGLAKTASLRDSMSGKELIASAFAEIVASERIDANEDHGNSPCYKTCKKSGEAVSDLLVKKLN